jgi:hypothetical protein
LNEHQNPVVLIAHCISDKEKNQQYNGSSMATNLQHAIENTLSDMVLEEYDTMEVLGTTKIRHVLQLHFGPPATSYKRD